MANTTISRKKNQRNLLWTALVVSVICNATTSILGFSIFVSIPFGLLAAICGAGLIAHYRRR